MKPARNTGKQKKIAAENNGEPLRGIHGSKSKEKKKIGQQSKDSTSKTAHQRQWSKDGSPSFLQPKKNPCIHILLYRIYEHDCELQMNIYWCNCKFNNLIQ